MRHASLGVTWFGFLAGPVAFAVEMQSVYVLAGTICKHGGRWALHAIALLCFATVMAGLAAAWREERALRRVEHPDARVSSRHFLSRLGVMTGVLFGAGIVAQWIAMLLLNPCP